MAERDEVGGVARAALRAALRAGDGGAVRVALTAVELWTTGPEVGPSTVVLKTVPETSGPVGRVDVGCRRVGLVELAGLADRRPDLEVVVDPGADTEVLLDAEELATLARLVSGSLPGLEARLGRARDRGRVDQFLDLLVGRDLWLPVEDAAAFGADGLDGSGPVVSPVPGEGGPGGGIVAYTAEQRLVDVLGDVPRHAMACLDLVAGWPDDGAATPGMLVDPGLDHAAVVHPEALRALRARLIAPPGADGGSG